MIDKQDVYRIRMYKWKNPKEWEVDAFKAISQMDVCREHRLSWIDRVTKIRAA